MMVARAEIETKTPSLILPCDTAW